MLSEARYEDMITTLPTKAGQLLLMGFTQAPGGEASRLSEPSTSFFPLDSHVPASRKKLAQGGPVVTLTREEPGLPVVGIGHSHGGEEVKGRKQNWSFNRDRERRVGRSCFVAHLKAHPTNVAFKTESQPRGRERAGGQIDCSREQPTEARRPERRGGAEPAVEERVNLKSTFKRFSTCR